AIKSLVKQDMLAGTKDTVDARVTYIELTELAKPIASEHTHHHDETINDYNRLLQKFSAKELEIVDKFVTVFAEELEG
ncbi:transcriptional regulator, partial [Streptococcus pyogenes]